jgi:hypothetical protein
MMMGYDFHCFVLVVNKGLLEKGLNPPFFAERYYILVNIPAPDYHHHNHPTPPPPPPPQPPPPTTITNTPAKRCVATQRSRTTKVENRRKKEKRGEMRRNEELIERSMVRCTKQAVRNFRVNGLLHKASR